MALYFKVTMQNFELVQHFESHNGLDKDTPDFMFFKEFLSFFVLYNLLVEVAVVCKLHDNAE